jgi:hypothetical protein
VIVATGKQIGVHQTGKRTRAHHFENPTPKVLHAAPLIDCGAPLSFSQTFALIHLELPAESRMLFKKSPGQSS